MQVFHSYTVRLNSSCLVVFVLLLKANLKDLNTELFRLMVHSCCVCVFFNVIMFLSFCCCFLFFAGLRD